MIRFLLTISLIFCCLCINAQTIEETIDWIKGKLEYHYYAVWNTGMVTDNFDQKLSFDYKTKILTLLYDGKVYAGGYKIEIPFNKLNPDGFYIEKDEWPKGTKAVSDATNYNYLLHFQTRNLEKCIKSHHNFDLNDPDESTNIEYRNTICIDIPGNLYDRYGSDFEQRLFKALKHAVILSGGKKETF